MPTVQTNFWVSRLLPFPVSALLLLSVCAAYGQDKPGVVAQTFVHINIMTEYLGAPEPVVEIMGGKVIPNYRPRIVKLFPSTGIVIDDKGHVLTFLGYRWVDIYARNPRVEIIDSRGKRLSGKLIGIDQSVRVAVILCQECDLKTAALCEGCEIKDGAFVITPILDGARTPQFESSRILSASTRTSSVAGGEWTIEMNRPLSLVGAPMLNMKSQVIGLVADQPTRESPQNPRVNVTILPVSQMLGSAQRIIKAGGDIQSGWLGVKVDSGDGSASGVLVSEVERDSPAQKAGLLPGDIMIKWNGVAIQDPLKYIQIVENTPIGSKAVLGVLRQGKPVLLTAVIDARKPEDPNERLILDLQGGADVSAVRNAAPITHFQSSLGIDLQPVPPQLAEFLQIPGRTGLLVMSVTKQAACDRAGIVAGDVILDIDGVRVGTPQSFFDQARSRGWGSRLILRLVRKGMELSKSVQLPKLPGSSRRPMR